MINRDLTETAKHTSSIQQHPAQDGGYITVILGGSWEIGHCESENGPRGCCSLRAGSIKHTSKGWQEALLE